MPDTRNIDVLNRLLAIVYRSLPMYMADATPWSHPGDERARQALEHVCAEQKSLATRIAELINQRGGRVEPGEFPMDFGELNFLSMDYMLKEIAQTGQQDVAAIRAISASLANDPGARALADQALGAAQAHLETFNELAAQQPA